MLRRTIEKEIDDFLLNGKNEVLLVTGARQVGKTYIINQRAHALYKNVVEINFIMDPKKTTLFENVSSAEDILLRISAIPEVTLIPGETVIFLDEVQEAKEIVTAAKFLAMDSRYKFIMSGSLLGIELRDIRSVPVGYLRILEMFPLTFFEFCRANGLSDMVMDAIGSAFQERKPMDEFVHSKLMELFYLYLIVGGMPAAVSTYLDSKNIRDVIRVQSDILETYKRDISKYDLEDKLYLKEIFELIPSELNAKNKRFIMKKLNENFKFSRYENSFIWLKDAGVALPCFCAQEPLSPLMLSRSTNLFKLFLNDVGLLTCMYADGLQLDILSGKINMNFGSIFENAVAQQLTAGGYPLYYYNSNRQGEVDFLIEHQGHVLPIEVKSGKNYQRHAALNHVLNNPRYDIPYGIVLTTENLRIEEKVFYYPIYMAGFFQRNPITEDMVYEVDLSGL